LASRRETDERDTDENEATSMSISRWIYTTALCGPLVACGGATTDEGQSSTQVPRAAGSALRSGIDASGIDAAVRPGDDFFAYANGTWLKQTEIPADRSNTGTFLVVFQKAEQRTADLIRELGATSPAAGTDARKVADFYAAFMNEGAIEQSGLERLRPQLQAIDAIESRTDLARVLGSRLRADVDPLNYTDFDTDHLLGLFVSQALEDPAQNLAYLLQGGLAMPGRDYYLSDDPAMKGYREKYSTYVREMLALAGRLDAEAEAEALIDLETKIATAHATVIDSEDIHKANNRWRTADFSAKAPGLDWPAFFEAAGLADQTELGVWQPGAIVGLSKLTADVPLATWKALLRFHTLDRYAQWLPKTYADLAFDFHSRTLRGVPEQRERWKRAVEATNDDLGEAVGRLYVERYFPASSKAQIEGMVAKIVAAFETRIDVLDWMTPATKANAKAKLAALRVGVGYPDAWRDYSALEVSADDALGNHLRAEEFWLAAQKAKLGSAPDHDEWWITPQTVNALNLPLQNALNFPAAILEPPFFDAQADPAANYGSIGAVIGHEISHSFDNTGAEFDADGRLANWWTPEDAARFKAAGEALVEQYDGYEALPRLNVNGRQTLGENIADLAGLEAAYDAYRNSLGARPASVIGDLSGDQRFFLAYAQSWREKVRDAALRQRVNTDGHAPGRFRAETVRNIDPWYVAFGVQPDAALFLAPDHRVRVW
jgi:putative endopeptidase